MCNSVLVFNMSWGSMKYVVPTVLILRKNIVWDVRIAVRKTVRLRSILEYELMIDQMSNLKISDQNSMQPGRD